jgi:hypothetical protein
MIYVQARMTSDDAQMRAFHAAGRINPSRKTDSRPDQSFVNLAASVARTHAESAVTSIKCVAMALATGLLLGAPMSAHAAGSFRPVHGGQKVASGFHAPHHRMVGTRHHEARPAFRFAGYGYAPPYRLAPAIVINNRVVINVPRPGAVQNVADLPVVMGIRRPPVADPVIHRVGGGFTVVGLHAHHQSVERWRRARQMASSAPMPDQALSAGSDRSRIIVVRGF